MSFLVCVLFQHKKVRNWVLTMIFIMCRKEETCYHTELQNPPPFFFFASGLSKKLSSCVRTQG